MRRMMPRPRRDRDVRDRDYNPELWPAFTFLVKPTNNRYVAMIV